MTREVSPARQTTSHAAKTLQSWLQLQDLRNASEVTVDGQTLDIPSVVAVAKYGALATLDKTPEVTERIQASVDMLRSYLDQGHMVYGVNTGFGGSADTRTTDLVSLQKALVQHQNIGVLTSSDIGKPQLEGTSGDPFLSHSMPSQWVRGLMLSRVNSVLRGHSAVSLPVIDAILGLLRHNLTPVIPLRGSISASGDLSPLSYVAATLQGNKDIYVRTGDGKIVSADEALKTANIEPVELAAKEGLGLLNGTAASASVASLALYETNHLATLSQVLVAMGTEALTGTAESFHPFLAAIRPHPGQIESAANIRSYLTGSRLAQGLQGSNKSVSGLAQDRYALRTSSQWVGPQLEDLLLASEQVATELNSTTDNPLLEVATETVHHGGNFQALAVTSAMEKTRSALQMFGKMLFAIGGEMINPMMNRGLPPNLAADDPSLSFLCKGVDISLASYISELGFLANPVSSHVHSAEMHNQAINSLALISGRYTMQAVDVLSAMCAAFLFLVTQALDLRVLQLRFVEMAQEKMALVTKDALASGDEATAERVWKGVREIWDANTNLDLMARCDKTASSAVAVLVTELSQSPSLSQHDGVSYLLQNIKTWKSSLAQTLAEEYNKSRNEMFANHADITPQYLGQASRKLYTFVRADLKVPFHRGLADVEGRTIGSFISVIYEALRDGRLHEPVMAAVKEGLTTAAGPGERE
ncbi:putative phenylalanine ammonia-lyase [Aulographum hederae CBS 113979]|uniref:Putative phenylalanine ammonia-lyase n=1 Tax=Aulographum hederae CBS 113979 TaxID=1176131 RepID=A0A6G1HG20_9PEZI|nr:putative phenylalanine ammonia-lyase [Aulographum hederae CBS 113979]